MLDVTDVRRTPMRRGAVGVIAVSCVLRAMEATACSMQALAAGELLRCEVSSPGACFCQPQPYPNR